MTIKIIKKKRKNYISWDDYFMAIAVLSAQRSKDPKTQVGACIVNSEKKIIGIGYNGFPYGCSDDIFPWNKNGNLINTKYAYVCHAEMNAIINSIKKIRNCTIYSVLFPCNECAKVIIQSGINKIIYLSDKYLNKEKTQTSKKMFNIAKISYKKLKPKEKFLSIKMS